MMRGLNLMSPRAQAQAMLSRQLRSWALAACGLVLALIVGTALNVERARRADLERQALEAQYEPTRQLNAENRRLRHDVETLLADDRHVLELARQRPVTTLVGVAGQAV